MVLVWALGLLANQVWQPRPGHTQIQIWPGAAPDLQPTAAERCRLVTGPLVAGRPWVEVENVSQPTMTVFKARGKNKVIDAADRLSCRPDFAIALYPGHLWHEATGLTLNPTIKVTNQTPPTLIVQAEDDPVDNVNNSIVYDLALKKAGVPVDMHLFAHGGHAFGLRPTKQPITRWPQLMLKWLRNQGIVGSQRAPWATAPRLDRSEIATQTPVAPRFAWPKVPTGFPVQFIDPTESAQFTTGLRLAGN
jgi:acetyl esterase/lipase